MKPNSFPLFSRRISMCVYIPCEIKHGSCGKTLNVLINYHLEALMKVSCHLYFFLQINQSFLLFLSSNRAAAFLNLVKLQKALTDAETTISLNPNWEKVLTITHTTYKSYVDNSFGFIVSLII